MKKKVPFFLSFILYTAIAVAQNDTRQVISSSGGFDKTSSLSLEWTLGETAIELGNTKSIMFTQGFHQPIIVIGQSVFPKPKPVLTGSGNITIAPNPVQDKLKVIPGLFFTGKALVQLMDLGGNILYSTQLVGKTSIDINMSRFAAGQYFIRVTNTSGILLNSFKVIKL